MRISKKGVTVSAEAVNEKVFRVKRFIGTEEPNKVSLCVENLTKYGDCSERETDTELFLDTGKYTLSLNKESLAVSVKSCKGNVLYSEKKAEIKKTSYKPMEECIPDEAKKDYCKNAMEYKLFFDFKKDEHIYGLGCHNTDKFDLRKEALDLLQYNTHLPIPFMLSSKNYGVFFDHYSYMRYSGKGRKPFMYVENCEMADYYIICGENADEVMSLYYGLSGAPGLLPKAVFGYIQSKERYKTQDELAGIVRRYREIGVPLDVAVQDWLYWEDGLWGEKSFDKERYPDPAAAVKEIHDMGAKAIISVWPKLEGDSQNRREMEESGQLLKRSFYNCFSEKGREVYYGQLKRGLACCDFDGYWTDDTEPAEIAMKFKVSKHKNRFVKKQMDVFKDFTDARFTNSYTYFHNKSLFEKLKNDYPEKRMFFLTRASFPGLSKYNTVTWSGDISASWQCLKMQIASLQNHALAGEPFCHSDTGAFFPWDGCWMDVKGKYPKGLGDKEYMELYTRWLQWSAFMPLMRSHGTACPREIWQFEGTSFYGAIEKYINLRMSLLPLIYSTAYAVHCGKGAFINPLFKTFSEEKFKSDCTEYMFGPSLLVCPVTEPMYYSHNKAKKRPDTAVNVSLPGGVCWYDFETDKKYEGGKDIAVNASINRIPVFVKEGSIIPTVRGKMSSAEDMNEIYIKVYPGKDASFTLYDDDGVSYAHEKGVFRKIDIIYRENENKLVFSSAEGSYKAADKLKFIISAAGKGGETTFDYCGEKAEISML